MEDTQVRPLGPNTTRTKVVVVIGAGAIGLTIARRHGNGKHVLLADISEANLSTGVDALSAAGYACTGRRIDVSSREQVHQLANEAARLGDVVHVVHTAGVSPAQAPIETIFAVDLYGTAVVLDEFSHVVAPGGTGLVVASMAGHMLPALDPAVEHALGFAPAEELLSLPALGQFISTAAAYSMSKRANQLRVRAAATGWGDRSARVNSISPGIVITPLAREEFASPAGPVYRAMFDASAAGRVGTCDEIATVAAFLLGPDSAFITGTDLLIDGGVIAALHAGRWRIPGGSAT